MSTWRQLTNPNEGPSSSCAKLSSRSCPTPNSASATACQPFRQDGKVVAGFAAFKNHLSYFPHSGSVLPELADDLVGYTASKGTLQFEVDTPLPKALVKKLIAARRRQLGQH